MAGLAVEPEIQRRSVAWQPRRNGQPHGHNPMGLQFGSVDGEVNGRVLPGEVGGGVVTEFACCGVFDVDAEDVVLVVVEARELLTADEQPETRER